MSYERLEFTVNGVSRTLDVETHATLADILRERLGLTGCRIGCDQAVCGACTVLVDGAPMASCAMFGFAASGRNVETIEGVSENEALAPLQAAFIAHGAAQCGYCSAGMVLSASALLRRVPQPSASEVRSWLGGNLCRCTGYESIVAAVMEVASRPRHPGEV